MDNRDPYARLVEELGQLLVDHIERHHPEASRFAAIKALGAAAKALAMIYGPSIVPPKSHEEQLEWAYRILRAGFAETSM
ncbi:hypothetical protein QCE47_27140 [Caballeronia sp. LZ025]|uniref:hypothetical protein n=1 Tax=Caballeronia TaxID=1827195 RepID=UPI001FD46766|nr:MULTISPECIES: hypothetical protein [Caballeronia]MDR5735994.1 hypothetical protein [Caballeronia sp. LZ025]